MYRIYKTTFHAAHNIDFDGYNGKCKSKHGHSYKLIVKFWFDETKWIDFEELKQLVDKIIEYPNYDHIDLGNITAEKLARKLSDEIKSKFLELLKSKSFYRQEVIPYLNSIKINLYETDKFGVET